jgi:cytoskeletal protein CcmA (bactofilin family)
VIHGDIKAPRLIVHEGAVINGSIEMSKTPAPAKVALAGG